MFDCLVLTPIMPGISCDEAWRVPDLAQTIAGCLDRNAEFIRGVALADLASWGRVATQKQPLDDPWEPIRGAELLELLHIAEQAGEMEGRGFDWDSEIVFQTPSLAGTAKVSAECFLQSAAFTLHCFAHRLADTALADLEPLAAVALIDCLVCLEYVAHQWCGLETDLEKSGPSRLLAASAQARLFALLPKK